MTRFDVSSLSVVLLLLSALLAWHGLGLLGRLWRQREHSDAPFWLVRGGRGLILSAGLCCVATGLLCSARGLLWFGLAFVAEEFYETGMVLLVLRWGRSRLALR